MFNLKELKEIPLTEICSIYGIELKNTGKNLMGTLRKEKTPSFCIYRENNYWKDFGVNEGGDSISLIQYLEGVERSKAISILASKFGFQSEKHTTTLPTKSQYSKIGINVDRAMANFKIDLEKHSLEKIEEWENKYSISMYELSKQNKFMYHKILDSRALPIIYDERRFFKEMLKRYEDFENEVEKLFIEDTLQELEESINSKVDIYNKARLDKMKKFYLKVKYERK